VTTLSGEAKEVYVRAMFGRIARHYDRLNRLLSAGRDLGWRRLTADLADLPPSGLALDVATGTGDLAMELARRALAGRVVGLDFSPPMLELAQVKVQRAGLAGRLEFLLGDALRLPFPEATFDAVTTGFSLRNVTSLPQLFAEMRRVVRPEGRVVCLEIARPEHPLVQRLYFAYFYRLAPLIGGLLSGDREAYRYLPDSLTSLPSPEGLQALLEAAGLRQVRYRHLSLGAAAIHVGVR